MWQVLHLEHAKKDHPTKFEKVRPTVIRQFFFTSISLCKKKLPIDHKSVWRKSCMKASDPTKIMQDLPPLDAWTATCRTVIQMNSVGIIYQAHRFSHLPMSLRQTPLWHFSHSLFHLHDPLFSPFHCQQYTRCWQPVSSRVVRMCKYRFALVTQQETWRFSMHHQNVLLHGASHQAIIAAVDKPQKLGETSASSQRSS